MGFHTKLSALLFSPMLMLVMMGLGVGEDDNDVDEALSTLSLWTHTCSWYNVHTQLCGRCSLCGIVMQRTALEPPVAVAS